MKIAMFALVMNQLVSSDPFNVKILQNISVTVIP